jgi:Skp family chaperone for outer membrane proteins
VKRTFIAFTVAGTIAVVGYFGSRLYAEPQYQQQQVTQTNAVSTAPPVRTKIALINLQSVIKQYEKWQTFEGSLKTEVQKFNKDFEQRKAKALEVKAQFEKTVDEAARDQLQNQLRTLDRELQDFGEGAKKALGKYHDEAAVQIYREVQSAVAAYARANDIELVMQYNDVIAEAELFHPANVARKLQTPSCMPIYVTEGMDITNVIANNLNQRLHAYSAPGANR